MSATPSPTWRILSHALCFALGALVAVPVGLFAVRAEQEKTMRALEGAEENLDRALKAEKEAAATLTQAEANFRAAKKAVDEMFGVAKDHPALKRGDAKEVRNRLLEKALPLYKKVGDKKGDE